MKKNLYHFLLLSILSIQVYSFEANKDPFKIFQDMLEGFGQQNQNNQNSSNNLVKIFSFTAPDRVNPQVTKHTISIEVPACSRYLLIPECKKQRLSNMSAMFQRIFPQSFSGYPLEFNADQCTLLATALDTQANEPGKKNITNDFCMIPPLASKNSYQGIRLDKHEQKFFYLYAHNKDQQGKLMRAAIPIHIQNLVFSWPRPIATSEIALLKSCLNALFNPLALKNEAEGYDDFSGNLPVCTPYNPVEALKKIGELGQ